jgi:predicted HTH domain antitoxin
VLQRDFASAQFRRNLPWFETVGYSDATSVCRDAKMKTSNVSKLHRVMTVRDESASVDVSVAVKLFDAEAISIGQGARMAQMSLGEFMRICSEQGVPVVRYPPSELDMDVANARSAADC